MTVPTYRSDVTTGTGTDAALPATDLPDVPPATEPA